jgi:hypothetical protein
MGISPVNRNREDPPASTLTGNALARGYENALRMLDRDAEILDQLRTRANILLAALAIGGTVFGAALPDRHLQPALVWLLGAAIVLCIGVLWSVRDHGDFDVRTSTPNGEPQTSGEPRTGQEPQTASGGSERSPESGSEPRTIMAKLMTLLAGAGRRFQEPWAEWRQDLGQNQRLWKIGLGQQDFDMVPAAAYDDQDLVDQILLGRMYLAHDRNNGTLSRRADLLRLASLLALAFVIDLGFWLR